MLLFYFIEPHFHIDENNTEAREIVDKILALPIEDRTWPNFLNRSFKNASIVDVPNPTDKGKHIMKIEVEIVHKRSKSDAKSAIHKTRSKTFVSTVVKPASPAHSISYDTMESLKEEKGEKDDKELEMSSRRIYD